MDSGGHVHPTFARGRLAPETDTNPTSFYRGEGRGGPVKVRTSDSALVMSVDPTYFDLATPLRPAAGSQRADCLGCDRRTDGRIAVSLPASAARAPAAIDRYVLHVLELSSKPAARRCCCRSTGQTDGRTDPTALHRPRAGNVTSAGWQVTLCDPVWHVSFRSGVWRLSELLCPCYYILT